MEHSRALNVTDVTELARAAVIEHADNLSVRGVTMTGEGDYAEVLIDVEGCRAEPCRFSVGVFRNAAPQAIKREIAAHLSRHVHRTPENRR